MLTAFYRDVYPRRAAQAAGCRRSFQCESAAVASSTCVFHPCARSDTHNASSSSSSHALIPQGYVPRVCTHTHLSTYLPLPFSPSLLRLIAKHVCSTRSRVLPCARYHEARACISPLRTHRADREEAEGKGAEAAVETGSGGDVEKRENGGCVCACIKYIYVRHRHVGEGS